jgi:methionyl-tRNA formyltransferase
MCYFWVLKNGEDKGGVTVHWIDEGIDTGEILARRSFRLRKGWTQHKVLILTAVIGARLIRRVARVIQKGRRPEPLPDTDVLPRYYPMPGEADFDEYFQKRRFFRIRDVFGYIWRRMRWRRRR